MFPTSTIRLTFFDRALRAQCSVKKSQSKCGSREHLKILPYNIMALLDKDFMESGFCLYCSLSEYTHRIKKYTKAELYR